MWCCLSHDLLFGFSISVLFLFLILWVGVVVVVVFVITCPSLSHCNVGFHSVTIFDWKLTGWKEHYLSKGID